MANLVCSIESIGETISEVEVEDLLAIAPKGAVSIWFGSFSGTPAELLAGGIPLAAGQWFEPRRHHTGIVSMVTTTGTVSVCIVV